MSITINQLKDLGFKPFKKKSPYSKSYDTLIYKLNNTDYLYLGYSTFKREVNNKLIWKSFVQPESKERIAYVVTKLGDTGYGEMKEFLERSVVNANYKPTEEEQRYLDGEDIVITKASLVYGTED